MFFPEKFGGLKIARNFDIILISKNNYYGKKS